MKQNNFMNIEAITGESATDLTYDRASEKYNITRQELERYAKIIAYKVVKNISNGYELDPAKNILK